MWIHPALVAALIEDHDREIQRQVERGRVARTSVRHDPRRSAKSRSRMRKLPSEVVLPLEG
jgi:hypothetical protein